MTATRLAEVQLLESERRLGQEMTEIGKELHDNLSQILGAAKMYIELAKTDDENREMCLDKSSGYLMTVIEAIRKISKVLTFPEKRIMGLAESINILLDDLIIIQPLKIEFNKHGIDEKNLSEKIRVDILRIVQEQLNNILKHANASSASINLTQQTNRILLQIVDDGDGCETLRDSKGVGIINIKSRAESHNGKVTIISNPGQGFELQVELPLNSHRSYT